MSIDSLLGGDGKRITVREAGGNDVQVLFGTTTPIYLDGDGKADLDLLCAGRSYHFSPSLA